MPRLIRDAERVFPARLEQQVIGKIERVLREHGLLILTQRRDESPVRLIDRVSPLIAASVRRSHGYSVFKYSSTARRSPSSRSSPNVWPPLP
jgi:hypothetical protein